MLMNYAPHFGASSSRLVTVDFGCTLDSSEEFKT